MMSGATRGVVYVATGDRYVAEAAESLASLRLSNPGLAAALITDHHTPPGGWELVIPLPSPTYSLRDKIAMRCVPWETVLFLDTDTFIATGLSHLFEMLESGFDLFAHQLFEGHNYELEGVPHSFPEFNTGVIGFRNTPSVQRQLFDAWGHWYDEYSSVTRCDQRSFRKAVYISGLRHAVLPPEYNFRPLATNFAIMNLRIIHGRPVSSLDALRRTVDVNLVHRAYVPRFKCVVSDHMTLGQLLKLWGAVSFQVVKALIRYALRPFRGLVRYASSSTGSS